MTSSVQSSRSMGSKYAFPTRMICLNWEQGRKCHDEERSHVVFHKGVLVDTVLPCPCPAI